MKCPLKSVDIYIYIYSFATVCLMKPFISRGLLFYKMPLLKLASFMKEPAIEIVREHLMKSLAP